MRCGIGTVLFQDGHQPRPLRLGFGTMMNQYTLECRMRSGSRHAQQRIRQLSFDINQFLQFRKKHILESSDLHDDCPLLDPGWPTAGGDGTEAVSYALPASL